MLQVGRDVFRCLRCAPNTIVVRTISVEVMLKVEEVTHTAYLEGAELIENIFNIVDISAAYLAAPIEVGNLLERRVVGTYDLATINGRQCIVGFTPQILEVLRGMPPPGMDVGLAHVEVENVPRVPPGMLEGEANQGAMVAPGMDGMVEGDENGFHAPAEQNVHEGSGRRRRR